MNLGIHMAQGIVPLVIEVHSADIMTTLLVLKAEVEDKLGSRMRMVFSGATEAHLVAQEIGLWFFVTLQNTV